MTKLLPHTPADAPTDLHTAATVEGSESGCIRPRPAEVSPGLAPASALRWIDRPRDSTAWLWTGGGEGAGKTGLFREIAERRSDALHLDCAGLHSEEVARELTDALGVAAPGTYDADFSKVVTGVTAGPVVLLVNTQWAGSLRTTREPERAIEQVVRTLIGNHERRVRMRPLIEVAHTAPMVGCWWPLSGGAS
ncbi:hypothetical protein [Streptomyces ziwulingensis]|uniref:ATP-binding protein n=1 Tax=Streptomyces ziwulingensis TaxID=1045501 RepID=A0ABP9CB72_9ACTN